MKFMPTHAVVNGIKTYVIPVIVVPSICNVVSKHDNPQILAEVQYKEPNYEVSGSSEIDGSNLSLINVGEMLTLKTKRRVIASDDGTKNALATTISLSGILQLSHVILQGLETFREETANGR
jgi:hypothetical protein